MALYYEYGKTRRSVNYLKNAATTVISNPSNFISQKGTIYSRIFGFCASLDPEN